LEEKMLAIDRDDNGNIIVIKTIRNDERQLTVVNEVSYTREETVMLIKALTGLDYE
jgi:hypothetical protein